MCSAFPETVELQLHAADLHYKGSSALPTLSLSALGGGFSSPILHTGLPTLACDSQVQRKPVCVFYFI